MNIFLNSNILGEPLEDEYDVCSESQFVVGMKFVLIRELKYIYPILPVSLDCLFFIAHLP
jgi:hypothetical protein